jgi:hypothetical protein
MLHCTPYEEIFVTSQFGEYYIFLRHDAKSPAGRMRNTALECNGSSAASEEIPHD